MRCGKSSEVGALEIEMARALEAAWQEHGGFALAACLCINVKSLGPIRIPGYDPVRTRFPCQNRNPTEKFDLATKPNQIHVRQPLDRFGLVTNYRFN